MVPLSRGNVLVIVVAGAALAGLGAPSWLALATGLVVAAAYNRPAPVAVKVWTGRALQLGVIGLGAGMNLTTVLRVGAQGALLTGAGLLVAIGIGLALGRWLRVGRDAALLLSVGTAICGGSAIAAVASAIRPKAQDISISLAVVFLLNAVALVVFPPIGHLLGLPQDHFGRWAALAIHDTSSVVGAGLAYGNEALSVATTTKLARALWIVPLTIAVVVLRERGNPAGLRGVKWPWFIGLFLVAAALFTWVPALAPAGKVVVLMARRLLVLALFLVGLSLSRDTLLVVGVRPLVQGVLLWIVVAIASLPLAALGTP